MPTSVLASPGELLFAQFNRLSTTGAALTTATDAIVLPGCEIEKIDFSYENDTIARQSDGCQSLPSYVIPRGAEMDITFGSSFPFDMETLLAGATSLVISTNQIGAGEAPIGSFLQCVPGLGSAASAFSVILWRKAYSCSVAIGLYVDVFPNVSVKERPARQPYNRTTPLGTRQYKFLYTPPLSGFTQGPGSILPATIPTTGLPSYSFLQSQDTAYVPVTSKLKFPGSSLTTNAGCSNCGAFPVGFLSSVHAVGGASNIAAVGGNTAYS